MAPSQGYRRLNDNSPTVVEDLEAMFYEAIHKAGVKIQRQQPSWFDSPELSGKPYRGKDPPCVQALMKGTSEGLQNEYGIRLCSYFINFKQYQPKTVREEILKSWNKLNSPELNWKELDVNFENNTISINESEKVSNTRTLKVSPKTIAIIKNLPNKYGECIFNPKPPLAASIKESLQLVRKRLAKTFQNP
jgi:hypothetical protein